MTVIKPKNVGYYVNQLKNEIPEKAFKPANYKMMFIFIHVILIGFYFYYIRTSSNYFSLIMISIFLGISNASIFTYCHELSHGAIIRHRKIRYMFEIFFWAINGMPTTVWIKNHNQNHHKNANNVKDTDRRTFKSEENKFNKIYNLLFYPNKVLKFSPTIGFAMIIYTIKHTLSVFYPENKKPAVVTFKVNYTKKEKYKVIFEIIIILMLQIIIALIIGSLKNYLISSLISWYVSSSILILLIITQHQINPVYIDSSDPLLTSTSIKIPKIFDALVDFHSYHTEHHIFPSINFDYYPIVSNLLKNKFPETYNYIGFTDAVKQSFNYDILIDDPIK